ncbi:hypothetical protein INR49_000325 [Caranx melampygus]|nr:hypothetical protein INR49_000325 [Caranx melampygus]
MNKWIELISTALSMGPEVKGKLKTESVKGELVNIARQKWPLHFSKFYEVTMMSGPPLPKSRFFVAVNWSGIFFMDGREKRLLELSYLEVKKTSSFSGQSVTLDTIQGDYVLQCGEAEDMAALIDYNLEGLRQHSVYAVAQQETGKQDDPSFLVCKRGDLLLVEKDKEHSPESIWIRATNQRTDTTAMVGRDKIQFLPTLTKPTEEMLELLGSGSKKPLATQSAPHREETVAPISIKEFALENFRPAGKDVGRHGASKGVSREKLWLCSREPLKQPLMKTLVNNSELSSLACGAFTAILKYMGDYPIKHARSPIELTNQIFGPATEHEELQDEIYCQIMRQMTSNNNRLSMERGWQLMWLCSGLFPPSMNLMRYTQRFLESRPRDPLASVCLQRLQGMYSKKPRMLPPHPVEVDAIQQNSTMIFHKIHFPNDTSDIFEVTSTTTMKDLCEHVASQLHLSSCDGYGLYLKTATKANAPYLVIYKRKLWFNVSPEKDQVADLTFHFPQELPKYLRGYHQCTKEDMINLGGLLFRCNVDSDRTQFVMIPRMLSDLVPADQISIMSKEEWKKHIISAYNKQSGITVQEAKFSFLRVISSWPTFGCSFFEVKDLLVMHPFSRILEYYSRGNFFQMTIGTLVKGYSFDCETPQADTMEDLLRSYVSMYERQKQARGAVIMQRLHWIRLSESLKKPLLRRTRTGRNMRDV